MNVPERDPDAELTTLKRLDLIQRRHHIYNGIVGKDLRLLSAMPPGKTDCDSYIAIPSEDEEAGLIHQHEWQHVFFKSDLRARKAFVDEYLRRLEAVAPDSFKSPLQNDPRPLVAEVDNFLHLFINCLDDLRVCSLWEDPYPQSAEDIQSRWKRILLTSRRYQQDICMYMMALGLGLRHGSNAGSLGASEWRRYEKILIDGTEKVKKKAFPACLIVARWILDSIIEDVIAIHTAGADSFRIAPPDPPKVLARGQGSILSPELTSTVPIATAVSSFMKGYNATNRSSKMGGLNLMDTDVPAPAGPDPNYQHTRTVVDAAMGASTEDQVRTVLREAQNEIEKVIRSLSGKVRQLASDQRLLKGMDSRAEFLDVEPEDVDALVLEPEDKRAIQVLHQQFSRLHGRKKSKLSDSGSDLDIGAYIDLMLGNGGTDIFLDDTTSKGFHSLILVDMSGSMKGDWPIVARACKVLAEAMDFPFSKLEVWGFTTVKDKALLVRFKDVKKGYLGAKLESKVWGLTPIHLATAVALRRLHEVPGISKHLVIISDGIPMFKGQYSSSPADLITTTSALIEDGRQKKIHTSGLVIGSGIDDDIADVMFGRRQFWIRVKDKQSELFHSLVTLVKDAFVQYLKRS